MSNRTVLPYIARSAVESAVGLILVKAGDRRNAMTISCFSEAAHHPTSMWISVDQSTYTHQFVLENGRFSFVALHREQTGIALACGAVSGRERDKCSALDLIDHGEYLFLKNALASTACRVRRSLPMGDHTLFIADMISGETDTRAALNRHLLLSDLRSL